MTADPLEPARAAARSPAARDALAEAEAVTWQALQLARARPGDLAGVDALLDEAMAALDRFLALCRAPLAVRCGAGCAGCCTDNPRGVTGVEAARLARRSTPEALARAGALAEAWRRRLDEAGDVAGALRRTRAAGEACMFLDPAGRCAVYEARPVACRAFYALTEPAWCDARHPRHAEALNPQLDPGEGLRGLLLALSAALGLDALPDDLRSAVVAAGATLSAAGEGSPTRR